MQSVINLQWKDQPVRGHGSSVNSYCDSASCIAPLYELLEGHCIMVYVDPFVYCFHFPTQDHCVFCCAPLFNMLFNFYKLKTSLHTIELQNLFFIFKCVKHSPLRYFVYNIWLVLKEE